MVDETATREDMSKELPATNLADQLKKGEEEARELVNLLEQRAVSQHLPDQQSQDYLAEDIKAGVRSLETSSETVAQFENAVKAGVYMGLRVMGETTFEGQRAMVVETGPGNHQVFALKPEGIYGVGEPTLTPDDFEAAIQRGEFNGHKTKEVDWGGRRAIEIEFPEGKVKFALGVKGIEGSGSIDNPSEAETETEADLVKWLESKLRYYEGIDHEVEKRVEDDLRQTMLDVKEIGLAGARIPIRAEFKKELADRASARIKYHNASIAAKVRLGDLGSEFYGMSDAQNPLHKEILFNTPGVRLAIEAIAFNDGEYFRLGGGSPTGKRGEEERRIRNLLRASGIGNPAYTGLSPVDEANVDDEAKLALELAVKTMHIFGESGYYDGIRVKPRVPGDAASAIRAGDFGIGADGWISVEVLERIYPDPKLTIEDRYAKFFEDHWGDIGFYRYTDAAGDMQFASTRKQAEDAGGTGIEWNQLSGAGSLQERATYYYPMALENPQTPDQGRAVSLRKYMYTWINSGVRFMRDENDDTVRRNLSEFLDNFDNDMGKYFIWVGKVSAAMKARATLNEKGLESVMNMPLTNPNNLVFKDDEQTISGVMDNFIKAGAAYDHLPDDEKQKAMAHLLKGILIYSSWKNVHIANRELRTQWAGLSDKNMEDIVFWAMDRGIITPGQGREVSKAAKISTIGAVLEDVGGNMAGGAGGFLKNFWTGITK